MATVAGDLTSIAPLIAEIPNYSGQILPDEWYQRINQILTLLSITAAAFDNPLRADILKSKMAGKYTNIPAQHAGNNIDIPAHFVVWLHHKYQTETFGTQQGVADGDANILGLLKGHLSGELYTWMKIANPAGINAFFTELKNMWLECPLNLYRGSISDQISQAPPITSQSTITSKEMTKPKTDTQVQSQQSISRPVSLQIRPQPAGTSEKILEKNMNKLLLWLYGETPEFVPVQAPSLPPKPQIQKNITSNTNDVDEITKGMADMSLNIVKMAKSVNAVAKTVKKSHRYCSNCGRIGHNSQNNQLLTDIQLDIRWNKWNKWKTWARNSEQLINNLNQQIFMLQNNPPNIAIVAGDLTSIAPLIAEIPNYSRQIPPDEWYQRINQILTLPSITMAAFDNPLRADILKSKMAGKYTNIPAQHAVGTQQVAIQRLAQEKFLPFDNPETYEARIRPLLLGVADGDANILGLLKGHLSGELYTWIKIANPAGFNAFFTELKNMWLERPPNLYRGSISDQISQAPPITSQSTIISREMTKPKTAT
ncbi:hypothetical protein C2G38_2181168 [Gigaspora rosea]|uniref:Uncharacterized protein n=1 Tax=Gigaspora rosea TaxID=44941 RepID=A0A397VCF4_9GLOM|nr:hypothetical protein C2G38_2181168 [Gigaspora rosea]